MTVAVAFGLVFAGMVLGIALCLSLFVWAVLLFARLGRGVGREHPASAPLAGPYSVPDRAVLTSAYWPARES